MIRYGLFVLVLMVVISILFLLRNLGKSKTLKKRIELVEDDTIDIDYAALEAAEKELTHLDAKNWVIVKRYFGPAYNHAVLTDIVGQLTENGIEATYDIIAASSVDMGPNNYVVKVKKQYEYEAIEFLEKLK